MKLFNPVGMCLLAFIVMTGCAKTEVSDRHILVDEQLPMPGHIWVYDFVASAADLPADSSLAGQHVDHPTPQTAEQLETGRQVGEQIAVQLVEEIRGMGLPAVRASGRTKPEVNDILIKGYLLSVQEGSATMRVTIGFGSGGSALTVAAEGFQMTAHGLRKLGSGTLQSGGGKAPGAAVGAVALIATANPAGLIIGGGMKAYGEYSGNAKIEGRARDVAKEIAKVVRQRFEKQGWVK